MTSPRHALSTVAVVVVAACVVAGTAAPAGAEAASPAEVARLARAAAAGDAAALDRLRRIDEVGGRPVAVRGVIAGADGDDLRTRLERLADAAEAEAGAEDGGGDDGSAASSVARRDPARAAGRILADERFRASDEPERDGFLRSIGRLAQPVLRPIGRALGVVVRPILRGISDLVGAVSNSILGGMAFVLAVVVATVIAVRRKRAQVRTLGPAGLFDERDDPTDLERRADVAAAAGDHATAVRLRFRAGLVRLRAAGAPIRPSMTTGQVGRVVADPRFDELGRTFDAVVYGGHDASADDARRSVESWRQLVAAATTRRGAAA